MKKDNLLPSFCHLFISYCYVCFQVSPWSIFDAISPRARKNHLLPKIFFSATFILVWRYDTFILTFGDRGAETSTHKTEILEKVEIRIFERES